MNMKSSNWIILIPATFLFFFYILPMISILSYISDLLPSIQTIFSSLNFTILKFTLFQSLLSTILAVLIGFPGAYFFGRYKLPLHRFWKSLFTVPFVIPPIVVVIGFIITFGPNGIINNFFADYFNLDEPIIEIYNTFQGILLAHVFYNTPVAIRIIGAAWQNIDKEQENVAKTLGASPIVIFFRIQLPQLIPAILTSSMLIFLYCFTSFGIPLAIGGVKYRTIEVQIYKTARQLKFNEASILALFQILFASIIAFPYFIYSNKRIGTSKEDIHTINESIFQNHLRAIMFILYFVFLMIILVLPLTSIILESFKTSNGLGLDNYTQLLSDRYLSEIGTSAAIQLKNTLIFALSASVLALMLGITTTIVSRSFRTKLYPDLRIKTFNSVLSLLIILPMVTSGVIYALGLIITYSNTFLLNDYVWLIIIIAQVLIAYPFVNRTLESALNEVSSEFREVSRSLGKSPFRTFFTVELPQIKSSIIVAFTFAFAIAVGEFGATNFLARSDYSTMTVGIYNFLGHRQFGTAAAMASVLIAFCTFSFLIIDKFGDIDL